MIITILILLLAIFVFAFIYSFLGRLWIKLAEYMYYEYDINVLYMFPLSSGDEGMAIVIWIIIMPIHLAILLVRWPFILSKQVFEFISDIPSKCRKIKFKKLLKKNREK